LSQGGVIADAILIGLAIYFLSSIKLKSQLSVLKNYGDIGYKFLAIFL
jgi:hypothetical protein